MLITIIIQLFLFCSAAFADVSSTTVDLDSEVKDAKFRTTSGSVSRISASLTMVYSGASLRKPLGDERPQVAKTTVPEPVNATGTVGMRYRLNKNESLYAATGFYQERPLREGDAQSELNTPQLSYNNTFLADDLEISSNLTGYMTTIESSKKIGELGTLGYSFSALKPVSRSRVSGGVSTIFSYTFYDAGYDSFKPVQIDYGVSFGPTFQYNFNSRLSAYTNLTLLYYYHLRNEQVFHFQSSAITQTVGLGWAMLRDIYLSPYVSFKPAELSAKKTSVNLMASLNVF